jgi:predicted hydrocarbon binding protein
MALKSVKYIKIDDQKGILYSAQQRALMIPVTFVKALSVSFSGIFGLPGARKLIYEIGRSLGEEFVKILKSILKEEGVALDKEMLIRETHNAIFMSAGWGKIEFQELNLKEEKIIVKITNSPSGELAKESDYALERGILAGCYKEITGQSIYYNTKKEEKKTGTAILETFAKIPKKNLAKGEMALLGRKELKKTVEARTKELRNKVKELEKFTKLTIGRELRMIELKKEIAELKR